MSLPAKGGSYVRKPDGSLERVAWTERAAPTVAPLAAPGKPAAQSSTANQQVGPTAVRPKGEK